MQRFSARVLLSPLHGTPNATSWPMPAMTNVLIVTAEIVMLAVSNYLVSPVTVQALDSLSEKTERKDLLSALPGSCRFTHRP